MISGDRWILMWRSAPESCSFTQLVSQALSTDPLGGLRGAVLEAAAELGVEAPRITLERPPRADFGDYSTNAALLLAPTLKASPRDVAQRLGSALQERLGAELERFDV